MSAQVQCSLIDYIHLHQVKLLTYSTATYTPLKQIKVPTFFQPTPSPTSLDASTRPTIQNVTVEN